MLCVLEIFFLIVGIRALRRGRLSLFGQWIVEGAGARLIGLLLVMPFATGFVLGFSRGFHAARAGKSFPVYSDIAQVELALWGIGLVGSAVIALLTAQRPSRQADDEEEYRKFRYYGPAGPDDRGVSNTPLDAKTEAGMADLYLTPEQEAEAQRLAEIIADKAKQEALQMARLVVSKKEHESFDGNHS